MADSGFSWLRAIGQVRHLDPASVDAGLADLRVRLCTQPIQGFELEMFGRLLREESILESSSFPLLRVAIVSGCTSEPLANAMRVALLAEGFRADVYEVPFGVYRQEILTPDSGLYTFDPQLILVVAPVSDITTLPSQSLAQKDVDVALDLEVENWRSLWAELAKNCKATVLQHTFADPGDSILGIADKRASWSQSKYISALNDRLIEASPGAVHWVGVDLLAAAVGALNWDDPRLRYHGKFAFSSKFLPDYLLLLGGTLRSSLGRARKALIVDLDNTLWGGVIGDDGMDGILLGPDTPEGEAYQAFCRYVGALGRRGVILGICSKNDVSNVVEVFEKHRHMPLSLSDFAVVRCNWDDKASNLSSIAAELNVDISSLVFVDDNPAECDLIRQALPSIRVIHMAGDPAFLVRLVDREHLFDSQGLSVEDIKRTDSYQARAKAAEMQAVAPDLESYLTSLQMHGSLGIARQEDLARLAQMETKTNQFNVTTRCWSSDQVAKFMAMPNHDVLCFHMMDRFTDHGFVGSMIVSYEGNKARILSWLLSCRVFSRTCEEFMLGELIGLAVERGALTLHGEYVATEKNKVISGLYASLGFERLDDAGRFSLNLADVSVPKTLISKVVPDWLD